MTTKRLAELEKAVDTAWNIYTAPCPCTCGVPAKIAHKDGLPIERLLRALNAWQGAKGNHVMGVEGRGQGKKRGSK